MKTITINVHTGLDKSLWIDFINTIMDTCDYEHMDVELIAKDAYGDKDKRSNCKCGIVLK